MLYPKAKIEVSGNAVKFDSNKAKIIILADNENFEDARYLNINEEIKLRPGTYYWKASNSFLKSFSGKFTIESEPALKIKDEQLVNVGNVKINVTKNKDGKTIGYVVLEENESEKIENAHYTGRQDE